VLRQLKQIAKRNDALVRAVRATYPALSWVSNRPAVYTRVAPYLAHMEFDEVRLTGHNNEPEAHLRRTRRLIDLDRAEVLVLGAGRGEELRLWERQRPRSLTATDYVAHRDAWRTHEGARFARADARSLPFADASFDLVASTALFEHIDGVEDAAREMARVARPGGLVFANFGPLYHTYGGAHIEGAYEHLWMSDEQLEHYLVARGIPSEIEDGLLWLRNRMFSKLRYAEYVEIFKRHFGIEKLVLAVSQPALRYKRTHRAEWRALTAHYAEEDLLTFSITIWMSPKPVAARRIDQMARRDAIRVGAGLAPPAVGLAPNAGLAPPAAAGLKAQSTSDKVSA
jgi:SAM-dependent methyltransferase